VLYNHISKHQSKDSKVSKSENKKSNLSNAKTTHNKQPVKISSETFRGLIKSAALNLAARDKLAAEVKKMRATYFDLKDNKDVVIPVSETITREMKLLDDELSALRATARAFLGVGKHFKLNVYYPWTLSVAVSTGLVVGTQTVDPSGQSEWVAASALFDEYKVNGIKVRYRVKQGVNYASTVYPFGVICYDPSDGNAVTSVPIGCAVEQHQLFLIPSTFEAVAVHQPDTFTAKVPSGIQLVASQAPGAWLPISNPLPYGYLKFYCLGDLVTAATNGGFGALVECHTEFRIRE
jgi:hypothetical protein